MCVHRDSRLGNLIVDDGARLAAVLDWELAHAGDPMEDPAWLCLRTWRFGNDDLPVGGFGRMEVLRDGYEQGGDVWRQDAFRSWSAARAIGLAGQADRFVPGDSDSTVARRQRSPVGRLGTTSEQAATSGASEALTAQATMLYDAQTFAYSLHTLAFAAGATIFYVLFARSGLLPRVLIGLGLVAAPLALIGQVLVVLGIDVPLYVFIPNLPFELGAGLWLLLRGHPTERPAGKFEKQ